MKQPLAHGGSQPFWATLKGDLAASFQLVRKGGIRLLGTVVAMQLALFVVAYPILGWLFREALRSSGMVALDLGALTSVTGLPFTFALIAVLMTLAFWLISLQFTIIVVLLSWAGKSPRPTVREVLGEVWTVFRKLLRPSSFPLLCYLLLVLPLTGFGFTSVFIQGISIPSFISGELYKSVSSGIILVVFLLALGYINLRLALTVPVFALTVAKGGQSTRLSWRLTGGLTGLRIALSTALILLLAVAATAILAAMALVPTAVSDALAPGASPVIAAYSLGAAQVVALLLSGLVTTLLCAVLLTQLQRAKDRLPQGLTLAAPSGDDGANAAGSAVSGLRSPVAVVTAASLVLALLLGTAGIGTLQKLSAHPETLVLAHRGFSVGGVENTISGLEAASRAGADLVEMDVMQGKDGKFVVLHDPNLKRLTGTSLAVKDMSLEELTATTVHDISGQEDLIPSLPDYIRRAQELGIQLLIEIKLSGSETPDHVDQLVAALEELDALDENIYHSLDKPSVDRLKGLRPNLTVGYTMAFAAVEAPDTVADFIVVEEFTATDAMAASAKKAGLGFMVWTVNEEKKQQGYLRGNVDGIITDRPDTALALRSSMQRETGLTGVLRDALTHFIKGF